MKWEFSSLPSETSDTFLSMQNWSARKTMQSLSDKREKTEYPKDDTQTMKVVQIGL